jgi:histidinol-phosphate aminotransferase
MAGELMGCGVITVPMKAFKHDLAAMARAVNEKTKAVFVANPNNPTGTYNTRTEVEEFLKKISSRRNPPLVIMDEAYYEYARAEKGYPETLAYLDRYPTLVVLRTFSKIYALAGLRVGYGFAAPEVVDYLDRIRPPFNINLLAQEAAIASLNDPRQVSDSLRLVLREKAYLYAELKRRAVPFIPSAGNFVLMDMSPSAGKDVFNRLLRKGVIVRAMDEYKLPNHIRVSIGLPEENRMFLRALDAITA